MEHDPVEIWNSTLEVIAEALRNGRVSPEEIEAIGIANQAGTTVFWNKKTGEPVGRAIVWLDQRSLPICERLIAKDRVGIETRTGMGIVPNASATKIRWLMENDAAIQKGMARGELLFGTIDSWLIWKLSGGAAHVTDHSNASITLLWNVHTLSYDEWMLNELAIPREILPELRSSSEIYAYTASELFSGAHIPIASAAFDQSAALFGQACFHAGMAKVTFGIGSSLVLNTGHKLGGAIPQVGGLALWAVNGELTYGLVGWIDISGAAIQWLRDGLGIIQEPREAEGLATQVLDTQGVYFVPAFVGLPMPHYDPSARGTIIGITRETTKHHIARAALEAMAYQTRDCFDQMKQSGLEIKILRADGDGAKSNFLLQFEADILGIPVERPVVTNTTVLGAAFLAGLAVGYWGSLEEIASKWRLERRFEPGISADHRDSLYRGWQKAIRHAAGWLTD